MSNLPEAESQSISIISTQDDRDFEATLIHDNSLVTSYLIKSPLILGCLRLLFGVYALLTVIVNLALNVTLRHTGDSYFSYFTNLSLIGVTAYLIAAGVQTIWFHLRNEESYPLIVGWPRPFLVLHTVLLSTIVTYPIIVTIVFWSLLSNSGTLSTPYLAWSNISCHALNTAYALFEILLTNVPPMPWVNLIVCIVLLACYLGVAYITYATQGFYTYPFLDPSEGPILAAYIVGIAAAQAIIFVLVRLIIMLRVRLVGGAKGRRADTNAGGTSMEQLPRRQEEEAKAREGVSIETGQGSSGRTKERV